MCILRHFWAGCNALELITDLTKMLLHGERAEVDKNDPKLLDTLSISC